jgi:hypothetical protein
MAEAVGTIFSKPDVSDEQLFKARATAHRSTSLHTSALQFATLTAASSGLLTPAQGTLSGWSGDVVPPGERKRLVARLDKMTLRIRALDDAPRAEEPQAGSE